MKVDRRRGVATVVGALIFVWVMLAGIAAYTFVGAAKQSSLNAINQAGNINIAKASEVLQFATSNGTLSVSNTGGQPSQIMSAIILLSNGTSDVVQVQTTLPPGQSLPLYSAVGAQQNCGASQNLTCSDLYQFVMASTPSTDPSFGNKIGILTSLGNTFWISPAKELLVANPATTATVTFDAYNAQQFSTNPVLEVDDVNYTYSQLPVTFVWLIGSNHIYTFNTNTGPGTSSNPYTTGLSTALSQNFMVTTSGAIRAYYSYQYLLTVIGGNGLSFSPPSVNGYYPASGGSYQSVQVTSNYLWGATLLTRQSLTGYSIDGGSVISIPRLYSGTYTPPAITMNGPHTLTLKSTYQYYLTMTSATCLTVSPSSGWHDAGQKVTIQGNPSCANYDFNRWQGYGTISYSGYSTTATITMNSPISETGSVVYVPPPPPPTCSMTGSAVPTSGPVPLTVSFTSGVTGGCTPPYTYSWSFGDGGTSTLQNPSYQYTSTGIYTAQVTSTDANSYHGRWQTTITVGPAPLQVSASGNPNHASLPPLTVAFTSTVSGGVAPYAYSWTTFGDTSAATSTSPTPSHTYTSSGSFVADLTVTDSSGKTGHASVTITIGSITIGCQVSVTANASPTSGIAPLAVSFTGGATGCTPPYTYSWTFGDSGTSTSRSPTHTYSLRGPYTATLTVTDSAGNKGSASVSINVGSGCSTTVYVSFSETGLPSGYYWSVTFNGVTQTGRAGYNIIFSVPPGYTYSWSTPSALQSGQTEYVPTPQNEQLYVACSGSSAVSITYNTYYLLTVNIPSYSLGGGMVSPAGQTWERAGSIVPVDVAQTTNGWTFVGWSGSVNSGANQISVTMTGPQTETATFGELTQIVTIGQVRITYTVECPTSGCATTIDAGPYYLQTTSGQGVSATLRVYYQSTNCGSRMSATDGTFYISCTVNGQPSSIPVTITLATGVNNQVYYIGTSYPTTI